jgi:hypothetical protein
MRKFIPEFWIINQQVTINRTKAQKRNIKIFISELVDFLVLFLVVELPPCALDIQVLEKEMGR